MPTLFEICKIEDQYMKAQALFEDKQGLSNPSSCCEPTTKTNVKAEIDHSTPKPNLNNDEPQEKYDLSIITTLNMGIFTERLHNLLNECKPTAHSGEGCSAHEEYQSDPIHLHTYILFQSVLPAIFPWTVKNSQTTSDILKVVLSKPNTTSGVVFPNWKKTTFLLPSKVSIKSNNIFHFTVQILRNKVDCGELSHVIFQPNIFQSALDTILKTIVLV